MQEVTTIIRQWALADSILRGERRMQNELSSDLRVGRRSQQSIGPVDDNGDMSERINRLFEVEARECH